MKSVSELIVLALKSAGIRDIFGIPSIHNIGFYEALRKEPAIRHILCRHESSATHMADGYARSGKGVGVVVASTGPGVAYTISPLVEAFCSCSPVLIITSNVRLDQIDNGYGVLHELKHQHTMFTSVTKDTVCLDPDASITEQVLRAVQTACSGRPGPVYMEVPNDLWDLEIEEGESPGIENPTDGNEVRNLDRAASLLENSAQPMIVTGVEAVHGGMEAEIKRLSESLQAPVLTDSGGKGILPEDHPLAFGNVTNGGVVKKIHRTSDATLAVGSRLRYVDFKRKGISLPGLIHMDWDRTWINKNFKAEIELIGDVKDMAAALATKLERVGVSDQRKHAVRQLKEEHQAFLQNISREKEEVAYVDAIRKAIPDDGMLVIDNTMLGYFAEQLYSSKRPLGLVPAKGASPIGFAFPAAVGLKLANPEKPVVALIGDGGFLYGAQELATCMQNGIAFPLIVVNDGAYRMIDYLQHNFYQAGYQTTLLNPDFTAYAGSFQVDAVSVDSPRGLNAALEKALKSGKMWLIEVNTTFPNPPFGQY